MAPDDCSPGNTYDIVNMDLTVQPNSVRHASLFAFYRSTIAAWQHQESFRTVVSAGNFLESGQRSDVHTITASYTEAKRVIERNNTDAGNIKIDMVAS